MTRTTLRFALSSLLLVAAACGGRVDMPPTPTPTPTPPMPPNDPGPTGTPPQADQSTVVPGDVRGIAVDGTSIYVIDVMGVVTLVPRAGGTASTLLAASAANVYPGGLVADDTYLYWTTLGLGDGEGTVVRMPKSGGAVEVLASGLRRPWQIALDDARLYWAEEGTSSVSASDGAVAAMVKTGGAVTELASNQPRAIAITLHGDDVLWANGPSGSLNGAVRRVPKSGGASVTIAGARETIGALAVVGDRVYWTESPSSAEARVVSAPLAGGAPVDLAGSNGTGAALVAVGDALVYATRHDPSSVLLLEQPIAAPSPSVISSTSVVHAISFFAGQVGTAYDGTSFIVDVTWADDDSGAKSTIRRASP